MSGSPSGSARGTIDTITWSGSAKETLLTRPLGTKASARRARVAASSGAAPGLGVA